MSDERLIELFGSPDAWCGLSASGVGPAEACPARLALPACRTTTEAADRGNALHEFARIVTKNPAARAQALLNVPEEWRHTAAGMNLNVALDGLTVVGCERAYALDVKAKTCRYIGENIHRDYNGALAEAGQPLLGRYEIPFSIDVEAKYGETPVELDYKSGQYIGDPAEHAQRNVCAIGLMLFYGSSSAISRVAYIKDDGEIMPDGHEFDIFDVDDFCARQVKTIDEIWKARKKFSLNVIPTVNPGELACKYCPAMDSCPYYTNLAKSMVDKLKAINEGPEFTVLSGAEKLAAWELAKQATKLAEGIITRLKTMAAEESFGDEKKVVSPVYQEGKVGFDAASARGLIFKLMAKSGASDEEIHATLASLNKKGKDFPVIMARKRDAA